MQLARLPKDLNETYHRILHQIREEDRGYAVILFQWLAFSVRPLTLPELAEIVQVDFESRDLPWFNSGRRYYDPEDILRVCSGFVSVTDEGTPLNHCGVSRLLTECTGQVKLAHLSVKEYLLSSCGIPQFCISEATSHSLISKTCLAYLAQFDGQDYRDPSRHRDHPLAQYAAKHWIHHGLRGDVDSEVRHQQLAFNVFRHRDVFLNWISTRNGYSLELEDAEPIYYASEAGLGDVVRVLLEDGADVNAEGGDNDSALQIASIEGHEEIVKMLLQHGADVNAEGGDNDSALQIASFEGHEEIVKMLLQHGADVNAQGGHGTALQMASTAGHEAIVEMLLEKGADVDLYDEISALFLASSEDHEAIVKMLLEHGADVDAQGVDGSAL